IVGTPMQSGTSYAVTNIVNADTKETDGVMNPHLTGSYSASGSFELQTVTGGQVFSNGTTMAVVVNGTSTTRTCTSTPSYRPPTTVPRGSLPTAFVFQFDPDKVSTTPLTLPQIQLPNSDGFWTVTIVSV